MLGFTLTILSGDQRLEIDVDDLDAAVTEAQRALTLMGEHTAEDYLAVCGLDVGAAVELSNGAMFALAQDAPTLPAPSIVTCRGCGQTAIDGTGRCAPCRGRESAPQGAQQQLFMPAPAQLAGQLTF